MNVRKGLKSLVNKKIMEQTNIEQTTQKQNPDSRAEHTTGHNPYLIPGAIVIAGVLIAGAVFLAQRNPSLGPSATPGTGELSGSELPAGNFQVDLEGWASKGDPSSPITIVEYADFACPFCGRFWQETLPQIERDYVDTGKVRIVYKDFIVVGGDRAAEAAHCAKEQGKYWEYHDLLFSRQAQDKTNWANSEVHRGYARELGLNESALIECFESRRYQEKVSKSTQEAVQNGGQGTPYFLINNTPVFGAQPYSSFQQVIESILAEEK
ncbi:MAG: DSBA oxidoreductase [Parcubacteria group bacterium Gr01-1014_30]|nr:MAG: DSBA oxidoreductase [Parcubacteria group bacterium Gr01-1014_30]